MSYAQVIRQIQKIMNNCGDPVILTMTGEQIMSESGQMSIEIERVLIKRQNNCCVIPPPNPTCNDNPDDKYWVNRIRISPSLADDYSKNYPLSDEDMKDLICTKTFLFGCY